MGPRIAASFFLLSALTACGDPLAEEAGTYHAAMVPLMRQNSVLAEQFLDMTGAIYKERVPIGQIADRMQKNVIPIAEKLKADGEKVPVRTEQLKDIHQAVVTAWTLQSDGYREMMKAYADNNQDAFNSGSKKVGQSKVMVENYIREVNAVLEPYGFHLEEFPPIE